VRIAFISYEHPAYTPHGGIAYYVEHASRMLAQRGHDVHVFTAGPDETRVDRDGVSVHFVGGTTFADFGARAVEPFAREHARQAFAVIESPDYGADGFASARSCRTAALVVRLHTPRFLFSGIEAASRERRAGLRGLIRRLRHGAPDRDQPRFYSKESDVEYSQARTADLLLSPSQDLAQRVGRVWQLPPQAFGTVPYPFPAPTALLKIPVRHAGSGRILFLGRLEERKGLDTLTAALADVLAAEPTTRVDFVGRICPHPATGQPYDDWIRNRLTKHHSRLAFHGPQPNSRLPDFFSQADICVLPSLYDNFPVVCLEAMAAGCAIIGSTMGGMGEQLDRGQCGVLADPEDAPAWARAMRELLHNPTRRMELGSRARERVQRVYSPDTVGRLHEQAYQAAMDRMPERNR